MDPSRILSDWWLYCTTYVYMHIYLVLFWSLLTQRGVKRLLATKSYEAHCTVKLARPYDTYCWPEEEEATTNCSLAPDPRRNMKLNNSYSVKETENHSYSKPKCQITYNMDHKFVCRHPPSLSLSSRTTPI